MGSRRLSAMGAPSVSARLRKVRSACAVHSGRPARAAVIRSSVMITVILVVLDEHNPCPGQILPQCGGRTRAREGPPGVKTRVLASQGDILVDLLPDAVRQRYLHFLCHLAAG